MTEILALQQLELDAEPETGSDGESYVAYPCFSIFYSHYTDTL